MTTETRTTSSKTFNIEIEDLTILGSWCFAGTEINNNQCNICKRDIMAPSYERLKKGTLDTIISLGKCGHSFHSDCIASTLKSTSSTSCPSCTTPWNLDRELDTNTSHRQFESTGKKTVAPLSAVKKAN